MNYESEFCRKVYDHHKVLKGEVAAALVELLTKMKVQQDVLNNAVALSDTVIDGSTHKMVADFQRSFARIATEK